VCGTSGIVHGCRKSEVVDIGNNQNDCFIRAVVYSLGPTVQNTLKVYKFEDAVTRVITLVKQKFKKFDGTITAIAQISEIALLLNTKIILSNCMNDFEESSKNSNTTATVRILVCGNGDT
jgi:hypothetical protein